MLDGVPDEHLPAGYLDDPAAARRRARRPAGRARRGGARRRRRRRRRRPRSGASSPARTPRLRGGLRDVLEARRPRPTPRCCAVAPAIRACCSTAATRSGAARRPLPRRPRPAASRAGEDPRPRRHQPRPTCRWTSRAGWCCAGGWSARACSRSAVDRHPSAAPTASLGRDEPLAGTASTVRAFLLVEHPGAVGRGRAPRRAAAGRGRRRLAAAARAAKVRVLLVRRPRSAQAGRRAPGSSRRTPIRRRRGSRPPLLTDLAGACSTSTWPRSAPGARPDWRRTTGRCSASAPTAGTTRAAPSAGGRSRRRSTGPTPTRRGRSRTSAETGSRRNLLVLPHGLYYGRLDPPSAIAVAGSHLAGQLDLDHLRGRSGLPMPVQAAEVALRRQLGETREGAVRFLGRHDRGRGHTGPLRGPSGRLGGRGAHPPRRRGRSADLRGRPAQPDARATTSSGSVARTTTTPDATQNVMRSGRRSGRDA